jgi:hypothetical protein
MPLYIKLSTNAMNDPKVIAAGPAATILWLRGLTYAKEHMTDGEVDDLVVKMLATGLGKPAVLARSLVRSGLWIKTNAGYSVGKDKWERHQITRAEIEEKREKWRRNKRVQRGHSQMSTEDNGGHVLEKQRGPDAPEPEHRAQSQSLKTPQPPAEPGGSTPAAKPERVVEPMPPIPIELGTPAFLAAWDEWLAYRRQKRLGTYTPIGLRRLWSKLIAFGPERSIAGIHEAIASEWRGIFPDKSGGPGPATPRGIAARQAQEAREL